MIVVLFNREEIVITQEEANKIDDLIEADIKWIRIGEYRVRPSAIALIKPGGVNEVDRITRDDRILDRPDYRGRPSPAKEALRKKLNKPLDT